MRARISRLFLRPEPPSLVAGLVVAVVAVAVITAVIYPLREIAPAESSGVAYLLAVLLVATLWGLRLGLLTSVLSAAAFNFFHLPPTGQFTIADSGHWVALSRSSSPRWSRARSPRWRARGPSRQSSDDARPTSRPSSRACCSAARAARGAPGSLAQRLANGARTGRRHDHPATSRSATRAARVRADAAAAGPIGTLLVRGRVLRRPGRASSERVVPALEALLGAALERERLQSEVVETRALRRSDELKTALLRAVSHDLRTPLTAIIDRRRALGSSRGLDAPSARSWARAIVERGASDCRARRQAARPLAAAGGRRRAAARVVLGRGDPARDGRSARPRRATRFSVRRRRATSRSSAPTPRSSSGRSRTCSRTPPATRRRPAGIGPRARRGRAAA